MQLWMAANKLSRQAEKWLAEKIVLFSEAIKSFRTWIIISNMSIYRENLEWKACVKAADIPLVKFGWARTSSPISTIWDEGMVTLKSTYYETHLEGLWWSVRLNAIQ